MGDATANHQQRDFILGYSLSQRLLLVVYVERSKGLPIKKRPIVGALQLCIGVNLS